MKLIYLFFVHSVALAQLYDEPSKARYDYCMSAVSELAGDNSVEKKYGEEAQGKCTLYYCELSGHDKHLSVYAWGKYRSCPSLKRLKTYETKKKQSSLEEIKKFKDRFREDVAVTKNEKLIPPPERQEVAPLVTTSTEVKPPTEVDKVEKVLESKPNEAIVSQDYNKDTLTCGPEKVDSFEDEEYVDLSAGVDDVIWGRRGVRRERIIIEDDFYTDFYSRGSWQNNWCYNYCFQNQFQYGPYQNQFNPYLNFNPYFQFNMGIGSGFNNYPMMNRYPAGPGYFGP